MKLYLVDFEPVGRRGACQADQSLLKCARQLGVDLVNICGGMGSCAHCKVQVIEGQVSPPSNSEKDALTREELAKGYRLACQANLLSDVKVHVPPESLTAPQRTQVEGLEVKTKPDPPICSYLVKLEPASLLDLRADDERLLSALSRQHRISVRRTDLSVLQNLSSQLRDSAWQARVALREDEVVAVSSPESRWLGLAVDLGTTKIAGYLTDLESGKTLAAQGIMNPQIAYGEDVIARIAAASQSRDEAARLQELVIEALNRLAAELCVQVDKEPSSIVEAVVVGNTAMHHLLLQLPVLQLAQAPYVPAVRNALDVKARDLRLDFAPGSGVHLLPNIAGFVGADHVAMLLATEVRQADDIVLALDIGTNTEICLANQGKMMSVSCASGPAFEGAHIKHGMRAAPGAIEHLRMVGNRIEYQTIGGVAPIGVCGSGLLDAVAQLYLNGVIDRSGRMGEHPNVRDLDSKREFVIVADDKREGLPAITIAQQDIRELQLAKGAIRTGIQVLLESSGHSENDIKQVMIAGAFGTYIDVASAIAIGMLPELPLDRYKQVGNAAGTGARLALISRGMRDEAQRIAEKDQYIELAGAPAFNEKFAKTMYLGASA